MAVNFTVLANQIATAIGQTYTTPELEGFAHGLLDELTMSGSATFGGIPGPHPISGMTGASMATRIKDYAGFGGTTAELQNFCQAICDHTQNAGFVTYSGPIPPIFPNYYLGGLISGLVGSVLASLVQSYVGYPSVTPQLLGLCTAVADHINNNAQVVSGVIS